MLTLYLSIITSLFLLVQGKFILAFSAWLLIKQCEFYGLVLFGFFTKTVAKKHVKKITNAYDNVRNLVQEKSHIKHQVFF